MSPEELEHRIAFICDELQALIYDLQEQVGPGLAPDTDHLVEVHYTVGGSQGLAVALESVRGLIFDPECDTREDRERKMENPAHALNPATVQRTRAKERESKITSREREIIATIKGALGAGASGSKAPRKGKR